MANTSSNLEFAAEVIRAGYIRSLAARDILVSHPAIVGIGPANGINSLTQTVREFGIEGADLYAVAGTEDASVAATTMGVESDDVTVGRYSLGRLVNGIAMDADSVLGQPLVARDLFVSAMVTETSLCAALATGWTNITGDVATEMSLVTFLEAIAALEARNVEGPYLFQGHTAHKRGLRLEQLLQAGGQIQYRETVAGLAGQTGLVGSLFGVDLYFTNLAPTDSGGKAGQMLGANSILHNWQNPSVSNSSSEAVVGNVKVIHAPVASRDQDQWFGHLRTGWARYEPGSSQRGQRVRCSA